MEKRRGILRSPLKRLRKAAPTKAKATRAEPRCRYLSDLISEKIPPKKVPKKYPPSLDMTAPAFPVIEPVKKSAPLGKNTDRTAWPKEGNWLKNWKTLKYQGM